MTFTDQSTSLSTPSAINQSDVSISNDRAIRPPTVACFGAHSSDIPPNHSGSEIDQSSSSAGSYYTAIETTNDALWPFKNQSEARLMHHYINNIALWFDHSDTIKHFGCILPNLAVCCPPLLNAILALSSHHLNLQGELEESVTLHYQDECFRTLLPDLQARAFEAPMLAAINIIRVASHNAASHSLLGLDEDVEAWNRNPTSTLHAAILMNVLRLYIHVALINRQPLSQASVNCCLMEGIFSKAEDPRVVNARITMLVVSVIGFCYDGHPQSSERWLKLNNDLIQWKETLPAAFLPTFQTQPCEDQPYGIVSFANDIHGSLDPIPETTRSPLLTTLRAASHQYYCLARLLLITASHPAQSNH